MNLEDRLREELDRASRSARVGTAPSVDELAAVADQRRTRNRLAGSAGAVVLSGTLLFAAFAATGPDDTTIVAAELDSSSAVAAQLPSNESNGGPAGEDAFAGIADPLAESAADASASASDDSSIADPTGSGEPDGSIRPPASPADEIVVIEASSLQSALPGEAGQLNVSTRGSAVEFAGGSGVHIMADGSQFRGLATKFGSDGAVAIGLSSINGLDWAELELDGVPAGATATVLHSYAGGYAALFTVFDVETQQRKTFVGSSPDMVSWSLSDALPGQDVIATDLAVAPQGVLVIGDATEPDIWFGPLEGPFEMTGQLDTVSLNGVTVLDGSFLVAGRSPSLGIAVFTTTDGLVWTTRELNSPDVDASSQSVSVAEGTIVLNTITDGSPQTLISNDAGMTWERLSNGEVRSITVGSSALGFLGTGTDSTVTLSDGESFATAELSIAAPDRLTLLSATPDQAVMLSQSSGGELTWIVASR